MRHIALAAALLITPAYAQDVVGDPAEKQTEWPDGPNKRFFQNLQRPDNYLLQTLLVVDFGVESMRLSCPHGTETNMPYAQARKRYEDYVRALDDKFFSDLNVGN